MAPSGGQGADTITGHAQHVDFALIFPNLAQMGLCLPPPTIGQPCHWKPFNWTETTGKVGVNFFLASPVGFLRGLERRGGLTVHGPLVLLRGLTPVVW